LSADRVGPLIVVRTPWSEHIGTLLTKRSRQCLSRLGARDGGPALDQPLRRRCQCRAGPGEAVAARRLALWREISPAEPSGAARTKMAPRAWGLPGDELGRPTAVVAKVAALSCEGSGLLPALRHGG